LEAQIELISYISSGPFIAIVVIPKRPDMAAGTEGVWQQVCGLVERKLPNAISPDNNTSN
jgi:hypothetical protein